MTRAEQANRVTAAARIKAVLIRLSGSDRWGLCTGIGIGTEDDPCLDGLQLIETPWFAVSVRHILRPDEDPHPHDHPWTNSWSWVICGGCEEQVWPDKTNPDLSYLRRRTLWSQASMARDAAHIITKITRPLWTVVITGRSYGTEDWGFWVPVSAYTPTARRVRSRLYITGSYAAAKDAEDGAAAT
jgi:hypothetical protein